MNTECLNNLVGIKNICGTNPAVVPQFYLDDIEGMTQQRLSKLASETDGNGAALFNSIKESAIRLMLADIDTVIPGNFRINNEITAVCSTCTFTAFTNIATAAGSGIIVKNMSNSKHSTILVESIIVKTNSTGEFTLQIKDGRNPAKDIKMNFVAGEELTITNIGYETSEKQISIGFSDPSVQLFNISCPASSSCGCGGGNNSAPTDIVITGLANGLESTVQVGILPCVKLRCSYDSVICNLVSSAPRIFGVTLLYLIASKAFEENALSNRINRQASNDKEEKQEYSEWYYQLYRERLWVILKKNSGYCPDY